MYANTLTRNGLSNIETKNENGKEKMYTIKMAHTIDLGTHKGNRFLFTYTF